MICYLIYSIFAFCSSWGKSFKPVPGSLVGVLCLGWSGPVHWINSLSVGQKHVESLSLLPNPPGRSFSLLNDKCRKDKGTLGTAAALGESPQGVTAGCGDGAASIPKIPGFWFREDCALSLNPSEAQWYHQLHLCWKKIPVKFKFLYTLQSGSLWGLRNWRCFSYEYYDRSSRKLKSLRKLILRKMKVKWPKDNSL